MHILFSRVRMTKPVSGGDVRIYFLQEQLASGTQVGLFNAFINLKELNSPCVASVHKRILLNILSPHSESPKVLTIKTKLWTVAVSSLLIFEKTRLLLAHLNI